jgi:hypothetical protein
LMYKYGDGKSDKDGDGGKYPFLSLEDKDDKMHDKSPPKVEQYCVRDPAISVKAFITEVKDDTLTLQEETGDPFQISRADLDRYDCARVVRDTCDLLANHPSPTDKREPLSKTDVLKILADIDEKYNTEYKGVSVSKVKYKGRAEYVKDERTGKDKEVWKRTYYHDQTNQCTHMVVQNKKKPAKNTDWEPEHTTVVIPIRPTQPELHGDEILRSVEDLPKVYLENLLGFYERFDEMIRKTKRDDLQPYVTGTSSTILCNRDSQMTDFLFDNGTVVRLLEKPLGKYYQDRIKDYDPRTEVHVSLQNQSIGTVSRCSFIYDDKEGENTCKKRCHDRQEIMQREYYEMSLLAVYITDHPSIMKKMTHILQHPVIVPIRKKQTLCDLLMAEVGGENTWSLKACKKYIEMCMNNGIKELPSMYRTLMDVRQPKPGEYVFSQREILQENHVFYFQEINPLKQNVTLYDIHQEILLAKRPPLQQNDLVSLYTKYPAQLKKFVGPCLIYTHILEEYDSDIDTIAYALSDPKINLTINTTTKHGPWTDTSRTERHGMGPDDLTHLSSYLWNYAPPLKEQKIVFFLYSNDSKSSQDKTSDKSKGFHMSLCMADEIIQGDLSARANSGIMCICLYQDVGTPFKNIVFERDGQETSVISLQELCQPKSRIESIVKAKIKAQVKAQAQPPAKAKVKAS